MKKLIAKLVAVFRKPAVEVSPLDVARGLFDDAMGVFRQSLNGLTDALIVLQDEISASQERQDELQAKAKAEKNLRADLTAEVELVEAQMTKIEKLLA
jgi:hypothetical protein